MNTRGSVNPTTLHHPGSGGIQSTGILISLPGPQAVLIHQLFNELMNGIGEARYEMQVGMSVAELDSIFDEFNVWVEAQEHDADGVIVLWDEQKVPKASFERAYSPEEIRVIRNMTEVVMLDLGQHDFQTRTGFYLVEAKRLLDECNALLLAPLHLDEQAEPVAH